MNDIVSICISQDLRQIFPDSHNGRGGIPRNGINKLLLGMAMIDQDLRLIIACLHSEIHLYQLRSIKLVAGNAGSAVHRIKITEDKIKVLQLLHGNVRHRYPLLGNRCTF